MYPTSSDHTANCECTDEQDSHPYQFLRPSDNSEHSEHPQAACVPLVNVRPVHLLGQMQDTHTNNRLDIWLQFHTGIRLHDYLYKNEAILLSCSDALHEPPPSHRLFIHQIRQLGDIDPGRARREGRQRIALSHDAAGTSSHGD